MSLLNASVTPRELRENAELFYALRDSRNNLRVVVPSDPVPLSLVADAESVADSTGQQIILTIINTLLRCGRRFASLSLDIPDVPLCTTLPSVAATTLKGAALELAQKVDPHSKLSDGQKDYGFAIVTGNPRCDVADRVYVGVDLTNAVISKTPFRANPSRAPLSAVIAANCAVAEAYKVFTPTLRAAAVERAVLEVPTVSHMAMDRTLLVGAGGIAHGLAWVLQWLQCQGQILAVDFDPIDTSNLNRYFCAFVDDVGADKPATLSKVLGGPDLFVQPLTGSYESLRDSQALDPDGFSQIITAVDNVSTRLEVQSDLPKSIVNAGTNAWSFDASRHSCDSMACLACLFPPMPGVNYGRRVRCGERTDGSEQPPVESYSFVNGLAGAYLALELAAATNATDPATTPQRYHGSGLHIDSMVAETRSKDSQCVLFCDHPGVSDRYRVKFGERPSRSDERII